MKDEKYHGPCCCDSCCERAGVSAVASPAPAPEVYVTASGCRSGNHSASCTCDCADAIRAAVAAERERCKLAAERSIECFRCDGEAKVETGRGVVNCGMCNGGGYLAPNSMQVAHRIESGWTGEPAPTVKP